MILGFAVRITLQGEGGEGEEEEMFTLTKQRTQEKSLFSQDNAYRTPEENNESDLGQSSGFGHTFPHC